ncbi:thymidylate synthase [Streptococcus equinus]|uniref:thymidylate synthase n=1 Tax=Streptococcus equinus TaxID=1335 RepID=UPI001FB38463|nr:thymidylate synthase [Streptococcus equinus]UOC11721.1 hypothetical protein KIP81_03300 [Streptococcus equinus]
MIDVLSKINLFGEEITTRGFKQKEILANQEIIEHPDERVIILKKRGNNIFALIAETMWVLSGRNDLEFLSHYLPRAVDFSDDKKTWRAAYGPRLRNWYGSDQFKNVAELLLSDPHSKRAVMSIFDPSKDYVDTLDVPCNNWLHFMKRNGKLNLDVAVRANDAIWGFGGINTFEWSVLLQMMAYWTNSEIGFMSWYTGTIHIYERHYERSKMILKNYKGKSLYDYGFKTPNFATPLYAFDDVLSYIFELEEKMRLGDNVYSDTLRINDDLLRTFTQLLNIYNQHRFGCSEDTIVDLLNLLPESDLRIAAIEYLFRKKNNLLNLELSAREKQYFTYLNGEL